MSTFFNALNLASETKQIPKHEAEQLIICAYEKYSKQKILRSEIYFKKNDPFPKEAMRLLESFLSLRLLGQPLQYVTKEVQFLDHFYEINSNVLIPRPETEGLVRYIQDYFVQRKTFPLTGIELGIGSGVISIELLSLFDGLKIFATEIDESAIDLALFNAKKILKDPNRLRVYRSHHQNQVFEALIENDQGLEFIQKERGVDFIVSNPPYLVSKNEMTAEVYLNEPKVALFAPLEDPLFFYRKIALEGHRLLNSTGRIFLEIPHERAKQIEDLFSGFNYQVSTSKDLNGNFRILCAGFKKDFRSWIG